MPLFELQKSGLQREFKQHRDKLGVVINGRRSADALEETAHQR
jgi:hypothetical protein